jgi:16S rRNA (adenine1518-N6/adenine1519-N6)-dimethyltransferase
VPKVDSAVVMVAVGPPPLPDEAQAGFFRLVAAGFGQRRKTLANSLTAGLSLDRATVVAGLAAAGIAVERRAETLTVADWLRLFRALPALAVGTP